MKDQTTKVNISQGKRGGGSVDLSSLLRIFVAVGTIGGGGLAGRLAAPAPAPPPVLRVEFDALQKLAESSEHRIKTLEDQRSIDAIEQARWSEEVKGKLSDLGSKMDEVREIVKRLRK